MSRFIKFTEEEIYQAAHKDIREFLLSQGEIVKSSGTEWMWAKHDSVKFRGHVWYRHSTNESGTAIDFLCTFYNMSFQEAVLTLLDCKKIAYHRTGEELEQAITQEKTILMPKKNSNNSRCIAYLCKTRKINIKVVSYFIAINLIYESSDYHNIVFIGYDKKKTPRHIAQVGTLDTVRFKKEVRNSDKQYSFNYHCNKTNTLYVFESPIDMLSYISIYHLDCFKNNNYVTCCGLSQQAINRFIKDYPHITEIVFCFDNDFNAKKSNGEPDENHGQVTAKKYSRIYAEKGYSTKIHTPIFKDFNDDLRSMKM